MSEAHHIGVVMNAGKPIVIVSESLVVHEEMLKSLRMKNTRVCLEQEGVEIEIQTSNIAKIVTGHGLDFDVEKHL